MCFVYLVHTHFSLSLPSFVSISLWPFVRSSAGLINHTHAGPWRERRGFMGGGAGVGGRQKLTLGETRSSGLGVEGAAPFGGWMDGWIYVV